MIDAEEFMLKLAPQYGRRDLELVCWLPSDRSKSECQMKEGNPFEPFGMNSMLVLLMLKLIN